MKYSFHPQAEEEFLHAIDYYEDCKKGLGYEFSVEVYSAVQRAVAFPSAWQTITGDIRRVLVKRFPSVCFILQSLKKYLLLQSCIFTGSHFTGSKERDLFHRYRTAFLQSTLAATISFTLETSMRSCFMVSRSRMVTVLSCRV